MAVRQAAEFAKHEKSRLIGLHSRYREEERTSPDGIEKQFEQICTDTGVKAQFITEDGPVTRTIYERSFWSDLLVLRLSHPPPIFFLRRFGSGLRTIIRLVSTPIMVVPAGAASQISRVLLAYGGGRKADEALYMATYLASRRQIHLTVVTVKRKGVNEQALSDRAREYLSTHNITGVDYLSLSEGSPADQIVQSCVETASDLLLMGGYEGGYFRELILGSTVDRVLRKTNCSVMICN
jgi:nucleotide-binding universal stress UspA family protein